jgi:hypothetical protein
MTLRERIADWISGGRLKFWRQESNDGWLIAIEREAQARSASHRAYLMQEQLNRIAALETPKASHTVRKMAAIAREAAQ